MRGSDSMNDLTLLGPWVRRFLLEHLVAERNLARNTQRSYRDALTLLIPFVADKLHPPVDRLTVVDVSADLMRLFLADLEQSRHCAITTRNQRLAAVHALAGFVGELPRCSHPADSFRRRQAAPTRGSADGGGCIGGSDAALPGRSGTVASDPPIH